MYKYFYYVWNLLKSEEHKEFVTLIGLSILGSILFSIIDWQYFILIGMIASSGFESISRILVGSQFMVWIISLWYFYTKYQVMLKTNSIYFTSSNRHYQYVIERIGNNASLEWIDQQKKSANFTLHSTII